MALANTNRGSGGGTSSGASISIVPASDFTGGTAILSICYDNAGTNGADPFDSVVDDGGGNWELLHNVLRDPGAANEGIVLRLYQCKSCTLTTSNTITFSFSPNVDEKSWTLNEITSGANTTPVFVSYNSTSGAATSYTITTHTVPSGCLVFGATAIEYAQSITADSDSTNGSWSTAQTSQQGSTTSGCNISSQAKVVSARATQTYNTSATTSCDYAIAYVVFMEISNTGIGILPYNSTSTSRTITAPQAILSGAAVIIGSWSNDGVDSEFDDVSNSYSNTWGGTYALHCLNVTSAKAEGANLLQTTAVNTTTAKVIYVIYRGAYVSSLTHVEEGHNSGFSDTATVTMNITDDNYVFGFIGAEDSGNYETGGDSDTTNGSWSAIMESTPSGSNNMKSQYKLVTSTGNQTYNATIEAFGNDQLWNATLKEIQLDITLPADSYDPFGTLGIFGI